MHCRPSPLTSATHNKDDIGWPVNLMVFLPAGFLSIDFPLYLFFVWFTIQYRSASAVVHGARSIASSEADCDGRSDCWSRLRNGRIDSGNNQNSVYAVDCDDNSPSTGNHHRLRSVLYIFVYSLHPLVISGFCCFGRGGGLFKIRLSLFYYSDKLIC